MMKEKGDEVKRLVEDIESMKKKVQLNVMELGNIKEDKRTKEGESDERQMSLEQNLLDVRAYVEQMLQETNKQLAGVAGEVQAADRKLTRCAADITEVAARQEKGQGSSGQAVAGLEVTVRELQEQEVMRRVEWAGELLELRGNQADSKAELLGKVETAGEWVASLRKETTSGLERLEGLVGRAGEAGREAGERKAGAGLQGLEGQLRGLEGRLQGLEGGQRDGRAEGQACSDSLGRVHLKVDGLVAAEESRAAQVRSVKEALAKVEKEGLARRAEEGDRLAKVKEELEGKVKSGEAASKEVDNRVENMRKNMIEMIGVNEMKTSEIENKVRQTEENVTNMKVVTSNNAVIVDNKLKAAKDDFETLLNDKLCTKSGSTLDLEKVTVGLRKEIDQVKTDLRNNDLESFKNIVNSTNDTHNKLISSIQKNVDQIIREKGQQEGQTGALEERITQVSVLREAGEQEMKRLLAKEQEVRHQVDEKVLSLQLGLRGVQQGGVEGLPTLQAALAALQESVAGAKEEMGASVAQQQARMAELQDLLNSELKNLKGDNSVRNIQMSGIWRHSSF
jgi:hypothetical protein